MNFSIRQATEQDIPAIHDLVVELAVYEKAADQVSATVEDYVKDFSENHFECIVAVYEKEIIGIMLYYNTYSTWKGKMIYLEDFVIKEAYRHKGIGQQLFDEFLKICKGKGAKMAKWQVLDWNIPAIRFYEKNKALIEKNWWNVKVSLVK